MDTSQDAPHACDQNTRLQRKKNPHPGPRKCPCLVPLYLTSTRPRVPQKIYANLRIPLSLQCMCSSRCMPPLLQAPVCRVVKVSVRSKLQPPGSNAKYAYSVRIKQPPTLVMQIVRIGRRFFAFQHLDCAILNISALFPARYSPGGGGAQPPPGPAFLR